MSPLAIVFPGQGCQHVGMAAGLCACSPEASARFEQADDILGYSLSTLCHEGPAERLDETANTQPAIYTASVALWEHLAGRMGFAGPDIACMAGHSLGEFSALTAAGALAFEDGLRLVQRRALAMAEAGRRTPGGMAAVLGLNDEAMEEIVGEVQADGHAVWVANHNAPGQVVVAGSSAGLEALSALARARNAKRVLPLAVSVACHTPLMGAAAQAFGEALEHTPLQAPRVPVVSNVTASPLSTPGAIREALLMQLVSPVRWTDSVRTMATLGVDAAVEVGPKAVLGALIRRIDGGIGVTSLTDQGTIGEWVTAREAEAVNP